MKFICDAFLSFSRCKGVVTFRNLPHVRVYRHGLRLIQGHETHTVCHLQEDKNYASVRNYSIKKKIAGIFFFYCTLVPTPGRVRRASRASTYGTVRRLSSHWGPWVSSICLALCCRKRALYPKPRSLRRASMPLSAD